MAGGTSAERGNKPVPNTLLAMGTTLPIDELLDARELCDETFVSKHEAFVTGFWHGQRAAGTADESQ